MKQLKTVFCLGFISLFAIQCFTTTPLKRKITAPAMESSDGTMEKAIKIAAVERGWVVHKGAGKEFTGELQLRQHYVKVKITYTADSVTVTYLDSKNLDYDGTNIHKKYAMWVDDLLRSVKKAAKKNA